MQESIIKRPATPTKEPDWQFMENYIKLYPIALAFNRTKYIRYYHEQNAVFRIIR